MFFREAFVFRMFNYFFVLDWGSYFIAAILFFQIFKDKLNSIKVFLLIVCLSISIYEFLLRIEYFEFVYETLFSLYVITIIFFSFYFLLFLVSTGKSQIFISSKLLK